MAKPDGSAEGGDFLSAVIRTFPYRNVIVFGDSLSDIGTKWMQPLGRIAASTGGMTVSPGGRFSDCRNWSDYLYEAATGQTLVAGTAENTRKLSEPHKRLRAGCRCLDGSEQWFRYANYAEGGACAGSPTSLIGRIGLGTFRDQVTRFQHDMRQFAPVSRDGPGDRRFLFLVWFGANDIYTDGQRAAAMPGVVTRVMKRRQEIVNVLHAAGVGTDDDAVRFVFMGMALPTSAARYQAQFERANRRLQDGEIHGLRARIQLLWKSRMRIVREMFDARMEALSQLAIAALIYNDNLSGSVVAPDLYVDMQHHLSESAVDAMMQHYRLLQCNEPKGWSRMYMSAADYNSIMADVMVPFSTSDEAHPTDRVYRYMWERAVSPALRNAGVQFGNFR